MELNYFINLNIIITYSAELWSVKEADKNIMMVAEMDAL